MTHPFPAAEPARLYIATLADGLSPRYRAEDRMHMGAEPYVPEAEVERLRDLLRRAHDAMSRREPDGVSAAEWDHLLKNIAKALGMKASTPLQS